MDASFTLQESKLTDLSNSIDSLSYYTREEVDASFTLQETKLTDLSNSIDSLSYYTTTQLDASFTQLDTSVNNILLQEISFSGDKTFNDNVIINGILQGSSYFYIDPAPFGISGETGKAGNVIIRGNLQVDGSQTIINSNIVDISDKTLVLACNADEITQADGAGIQIMDASGPSITYNSAINNWVVNRDILGQNISVNNIEIKDVSNLNINTDLIIHKTMYAKKFIFSKHLHLLNVS